MDHVPANGRSGGIVSMWDPSVFKVHDSIKHSNFLLTMGVLKGSNKAVNIINVYAPQKVTQKKALWDDIGGVVGSCSGWWVVLGDFNAVRYFGERRNSFFNKKCASNFNNFIFDNGLREYDMKGGKFTYLNDNGNKQSKIDRVLVCHEFFSEWPTACLRALPRVHSDHCPIVLTCSDKNFGPKPFRFFNSWLERNDFEEVVYKAIENFNGGGEADVVLMQKFKSIREGIKKWKKEVLAKEGEMERIIKGDVEKLDKLLESRELTEEEEWSKLECLKDLKELE
ncbi:putative endonuclease/exonuclease/phosphatase [Helianthus annuus]|nr:putative endonuclease/exonuclease/phosphatase [Helianthus annuus]